MLIGKKNVDEKTQMCKLYTGYTLLRNQRRQRGGASRGGGGDAVGRDVNVDVSAAKCTRTQRTVVCSTTHLRNSNQMLC